MKSQLKRSTFLSAVLVAGVVLAGAANSAGAAEPIDLKRGSGQPILKNGVHTLITAWKGKVHKYTVTRKGRIPFKKIEHKPEHLKAPVELDDGRKIDAKKYLEELNNYEKTLNEGGLSVQAGPDREALEHPDAAKNREELTKKETNKKRRHKHLKGKRIGTMTRLQALKAGLVTLPGGPRPRSVGLDGEQQPMAFDAEQMAEGPAQTVAWKKGWNDCIGNSKIKACLDVGIEISGDSSRVSDAKAWGTLSGEIVGNKADILKVTASANAPKTGNQTLKFQVDVMGKTAYSVNESKNLRWTYKKHFEKNFDWAYKQRFMAGPIPLSVKIGARGAVGLDVGAELEPVSAKVYAVPYAKAAGYAEGGVDAVVASAKIRASLNFADIRLPLRGEVAAVMTNGRPGITASAAASIEGKFLNGSIGAEACVKVPKWGIPPWKNKCHDWTFFKWDGITYNRNVLTWSKTL